MNEYLITCLIGYVLGCFNTAYVIGKIKGFDIRDTGSGNAGASNIKIALGWKFGAIVAFVDILKSFLAVYICRYLFPNNEIIPFLAGAMAIIGHIFPFYMKFKGGKGFACYIGMLLAINWKLLLVLIIIGVIITVVTNYIALATIFTATATPAYYIYLKANVYIIVILIVLLIIILFKHRINIQRIIRHEEIGLRKTQTK